MGRTPRYEYASPNAPWNRPIRPKTPQARESLVRRHLDELLPPIDNQPGEYGNPYFYKLYELIGDIIHEKAVKKTRRINQDLDEQPEMDNLEPEVKTHYSDSKAYRIAAAITLGHEWRYPQTQPSVITRQDRERIVEHLIRHADVPLRAFTMPERIRQCDDYQRQAAEKRQK